MLGIGDRYRRHVGTGAGRASEREREGGKEGVGKPLPLLAPRSPGSCLAHKESSESPFLPDLFAIVLQLLRLVEASSVSLSLRLPPPSSCRGVPSSLPSAPFLAALPHANARTKRNCSRGPSGPLARVPPGPPRVPVLGSPSSSFIWPVRLFGQI